MFVEQLIRDKLVVLVSFVSLCSFKTKLFKQATATRIATIIFKTKGAHQYNKNKEKNKYCGNNKYHETDISNRRETQNNNWLRRSR